MALGGALLTGGLNLLGGLFGAGSAKRAAKQQMQLQDTLNENDARRQLGLLQSQNFETWRINEYIREYNADVMANHSDSTREETSRTSSTGSIDFKRLVADAEAAGFNPITVLRSGGLAGYSSQNTDFYSNVKERNARDVMTFLAPPEVPTMGYNGQVQTIQPSNPIGDAINAGLNYFNNYDPTKAQRRELEMGLTRAQIENLNSETRRNMLLNVPNYTGSNVVSSAGGLKGMIGSVFGGHSQDSPFSEEGKRSVTNWFPTGSGLKVNPDVIDAAAFEERMGDSEIGQTAVMIYNGLADLGYNVPPPRNYANEAGLEIRSWLIDQYNALTDSWTNGGTGRAVPIPTGKPINFPFRLETTRP